MAKSRLLTPDITLKVGDYLKEVSAKKSFRIYKITSIEDNYMRLDVKFEIDRGRTVPVLNYRTFNIGADVDAHHYTKGSRLKTYILEKDDPYVLLHGD